MSRLLVFVLLLISSNNFAQICLWADLINNQLGSGNDVGIDIYVDNDGNRYVTGRWKGGNRFGNIYYPTLGDRDNFIAKYDSLGNPLWARRMGGAGSDYGYSVCGDSIGNIFLAGYFTGNEAYYIGDTMLGNGSSDIWVARVTSNGNLMWVKSFGGNSVDAGFVIRTKGNSNLIMIGEFSDTITFGSNVLISKGTTDIFIVELDYNGNVVKAKQIGTIGDDSVNEMVMDDAGNIYFAGYFSGTLNLDAFTLTGSGSRDILVAKIDSSFNTVWVKKGGSPQSEEGRGIAVDPATKEVYVTGNYKYGFSIGSLSISASTGTSDMYLIKLDSMGNPIWVNGGGGSLTDRGDDVDLDEFGNPVVVGFFQSTATFGTLDPVTPSGANDLYIYKVSKDGSSRKFKNYRGIISGGVSPSFQRMAFDNKGFLHICGSSVGGIYFDSIYLVSSGGTSDVFTGRFSPILDVKIQYTYDSLCPGEEFVLTDLSEGKVNSRNFVFSSSSSSYTFTDSIVSFVPPDEGYYSLLAFISNGYETDTVFLDSIFYRNPDATFTLGADTMVCPGSFIINPVSSSSGSVFWNTGETTQSIEVEIPDLYSAEFTDLNGCNYLDTVLVDFYPGNPVILGSDLSLCLTDTILFDVNDILYVQYEWQDGSTAPTLEVSQPGSYYVSVMDVNNCYSSDTVLVVEDSLFLSFTGDGDTLLCSYPEYVLIPNVNETNIQYTWSDGSQQNVLTVVLPGTYWLNVTDQYGCSASDTIQVDFFATPTVDLGPDSLLCDGQSLLLDAGSGFISYMWQDGSGSQFFAVDTSGIYMVEVTDGNSCMGADTIEVTLDDCSGINEKEASAILIYPNPVVTNNEVSISLDPGFKEVYILDMAGKCVYSGTHDNSENLFRLKCHFEPGLYFVKINSVDGREYLQKLVIE